LSTSSALLAALLAAAPQPVETIERAVDLVADRVLPVYRAHTKPECVTFMAEGELNRHFDIAIREKHNEKCGGDPATAPVRDRFRVLRGTRTVQWYEPVNGEYVPFERFLQSRRN
jgi:hypothetical protein